MATRQRTPSKVGKYILPVIASLFVGYFAYHAVEGDLGLVGAARLQGREAQLQEELQRLQAERHLIEAKVSMLRPSEIDEDVLDERARAVLNFANPNDVVIMLPPTDGQANNQKPVKAIN